MTWPHRALRSIEKEIASMRAEANFTNKQDWKEEQVFKLQTKRASILAGIGLPSGWEDAVDESSSNSRSLHFPALHWLRSDSTCEWCAQHATSRAHLVQEANARWCVALE